jgi:hypothetical protein
MLLHWDDGGRIQHRSDPLRRLERVARSLYRFASLVTAASVGRYSQSWALASLAQLGSTFIFQHVQAGVPVGRIDQSVPRYIEIGCFGGERDVGPRIDQFG